jgi:hypothetical protein
MKIFEFDALLLGVDDLPNNAYFEFPYSAKEVFGTKARIPVILQVDGLEVIGSLMSMGGDTHIMGLRKDFLPRLGKKAGDTVHVILQKDESVRTVSIPADLQDILNQIPGAAAAFDKLSYSHRRGYVNYLDEAKKPETRQKRLEKILAAMKK